MSFISIGRMGKLLYADVENVTIPDSFLWTVDCLTKMRDINKIYRQGHDWCWITWWHTKIMVDLIVWGVLLQYFVIIVIFTIALIEIMLLNYKFVYIVVNFWYNSKNFWFIERLVFDIYPLYGMHLFFFIFL